MPTKTSSLRAPRTPLARATLFASLALAIGAACAPLGGSGDPTVRNQRECDGECETRALSQVQVATILQQAINELAAQQVLGATVAVVDRLGNVLAVLDFGRGSPGLTIGSSLSAPEFPGNGLEGFSGLRRQELGRLAAISKAGTAAYLSTQGAALSTRTFSQVIQEAFNPSELMQPSGPLFGLQLSQLPCSDFVRRSSVLRPLQGRAGPKDLPLGMSGDPGGAPLYIEGDLVGGIGVESDGFYRIDRSVADDDFDIEEVVAFAAQRSFQPSRSREASGLIVRGKLLRYRDAMAFLSPPEPALLSGPPMGGQLVDVEGVFRAADGIRPGARLFANGSGYALLDSYFAAGPVRIPVTSLDRAPYLGMTALDPSVDPNATLGSVGVSNPRDSISPRPSDGGISQGEAGTIVSTSVQLATRVRALHRRANQSRTLTASAQVSVALVDLSGNVIALVESPDAPIYASDVAIQLARTAAFFSRGSMPADPAIPASPADELLADDGLGVDEGLAIPVQSKPLGVYVADSRTLLSNPTLFADGIGFSTRSIGNLARPFFPDGINGLPPGPLSQPISTFSPFNTGLQLDVAIDRLLAGLIVDLPTQDRLTCADPTLLELRGGMQISPGGVPVFRNGVVVGGLGVAGDGPDQNDLLAFEGLERAAIQLGGTGIGDASQVGNAPVGLRSDRLRATIPGGASVALRYVNCPPSPFVDDPTENDICQD